jgi:hypothetical protein
MNLVVALAALVIGCATGAIGGWTLRRAVVRWCRECGQPVDSRCVDCRDRQRAANLRNARNQNGPNMLSDAP